MTLYFDHLVHFVKGTPIEAIKKMELHGWEAVSGGRHEMWGTYNSLMYAGLSYIEFLAVENTETAKKSTNPLIELLVKDEEGFGQVCLRTNDIQKWKEDLERKGIQTSSVINAERRRENGDLLKWKMLFIEERDTGLPYSFFIEWSGDDEKRLSEMKQSGIIPQKQLGRKISSVHFGVKDIEATAEKWSSLLNIQAGEAYMDSRLGSFCKSITIGDTELIFIEPGENDYMTELLAKKGERPFLVTFDGNEASETVEIFGGLYSL
ncbi:VOC family protein [Bacillus sp. V59.32b]|uniref:VOC family protein n=1 Tax=Bacillus sp. V59.32b TaxID=1758642 RepID=UPI000E3B8D49|nr:VOC family protein [Bacillus sp. V59.32b]RFU68265.1 VOC family protein [Bacillus sp. V59.32b]